VLRPSPEFASPPIGRGQYILGARSNGEQGRHRFRFRMVDMGTRVDYSKAVRFNFPSLDGPP
jgi:hypothetical protein